MNILRVAFCSLILLTLLPVEALCNDGCTATGVPGCGGCTCQSCVCGMDPYCCETAWDDLCVGECQDCGGCGGGGDPGGGACGTVSYEGCCEGQVVKYCDGGQLQQLDCSENPSCGWSPEYSYYDCGTTGGQDPSGANPKSCGGGGTSPVCGNGWCETGESQANCPADCTGGGGTVCGNGTCEAGETAGSCPQDCVSGCVPDCTGKTCGPNGCNGSCGNCPPDFWCDIQGQCQSMNGCTANCTGKSCDQDDGCGEPCGCPDGQVCISGSCQLEGKPSGDTSGEYDDAWAGDGECIPQCKTLGKACGSDGCGGSCGICGAGYGCNLQGLCEEGYLGPPDNSPYMCPEGSTLLYGKCVADGTADKSNDGCSAHINSAPAVPGMLLMGLVLGLLLCLGLRRTSE